MMPASKDHMISAETLGGLLSVLTNLVWLGVVALMARVFGDLIAGQPVAPVRTGLWLLALWGLRAALDMKAQELLAHAADARIDALRPEIVTLEAQAATPSALGGAGSIAALAAEKLESMRPALLRYRPACLRVMAPPPPDDPVRRSVAGSRIAFLSSTRLELFSALGVAMVAIWVGSPCCANCIGAG